MRVLIDTNILTRSAQPDHTQHSIALQALKTLRAQGNEPCIVPQIVYEYWAVCTRPLEANGLGMAPSDVQARVAQTKRLFTLLRDERAIFSEWERLVAQYEVKGKSSHDARLVAAMVRHGLKHILTFNAPDFTRYNAILAFTPVQIIESIA